MSPFGQIFSHTFYPCKGIETQGTQRLRYKFYDSLKEYRVCYS